MPAPSTPSGDASAVAADRERPMLDAAGDAVIVTDLEGHITSWNRAAEVLYGWMASEAVGRNVLDVTPSDLSRDQAQQILEQLSRGQSWQGQFVVQRRDGTPFIARITDAPLLDADGKLIGIIGVSQDVGAAEGAIRHLAYLAEASRLLGASLDYGRTLQDVARVLVPGFADTCSVFIEEDGVHHRVAQAARGDGVEDALRALRTMPTPRVLTRLFAEVMEMGRARLINDYAAYLDSTDEGDAAYAAVIRRIDVADAVIAPILVRGKPIGALAVGVLRRGDRRFGAGDATFTEELAHRVGVAIDNARLYGKAEAARLAVEQREASLVEERRIFETLYRIGTSLANELDEQKLIQRVTDEATS
ncbi:MAG: two-component system, sensor histidine kinase and response regulator, partial [Myxococcales bacterium]|nr:two-component system, sensor histidine kinase and response regulator [Myxococcales bacterium]